MEPSNLYRPRVSRETRLLVTTGVLAVTALWLLARISQERPASPSPVPSVLSQLAGGTKYDDLAEEIARLRARLEPFLVALDVPSSVLGPLRASRRVAALRLREGLAVALLPAGSNTEMWNDERVLASDPASGLLVVRLASQAPGSPPTPWTPRQLQLPRYLIATDVSSQGVSLRPGFVGSLDSIESPLWPDPIWAVPGRGDLTPGSFVFTNNAELVGLVFARGTESVVVPGGTVLAEVDRLLATPKRPPGTVGCEVQALTDSLASLTGAPAGVVVTWVEREGAAAGRLEVGDVIEAVDGRTLATREHWDVRMARMFAGETLTLRVRGGGTVREVTLVATAVTAPPVAASRSLGLTLRGRTGIGAEVLRVERASAADRAGLAAGDLVTLVAEVPAPTPAQITRSFASLREGQRVMIAVTRGNVRRVTTLER